jgi:hypothetical protein
MTPKESCAVTTASEISPAGDGRVTSDVLVTDATGAHVTVAEPGGASGPARA